MKKIMVITVILCILALTGCNTFSGVGKDVKAGGSAISNTAEKTQSKM